MGAVITDTTGSIVTVEVTGRLTESELAAVQNHMAEIIREQGKVRILVLTIAFKGWQSGECKNITFKIRTIGISKKWPLSAMSSGRMTR